jgi:hypothetical protein
VEGEKKDPWEGKNGLVVVTFRFGLAFHSRLEQIKLLEEEEKKSELEKDEEG